MSTYLEELSANIPLNEERSWKSMAEEACATVDALRDENARLKADAKAAKEREDGLRRALEGLLDEQNGVPLFTREKEYLSAVEAARTALLPAHTQTKST